MKGVASRSRFFKVLSKTLAGLEAAREKGNIGGRPKGLTKKAQNIALTAEYLYKEEKLSVNEILDQLLHFIKKNKKLYKS